MRAILSLCAICTACSGDEIDLDNDGSFVVTADCTGAEPFAEGMEAVSVQGRTVVLSGASPAPPDVGDNTWTLIVQDDTGPLSGLGVSVRPWMPLHGHGLSPARYAGTEASPGTYSVEVFDVIMPGLWEFWVELDDGDEAMFPLCAEG